MKLILLDTNMLIYREGEKKLDESIQLLLRMIMDSQDYKIMIHPFSIVEIKGHKDEKERDIILSKLKSYPMLDKPPIRSEDFLLQCGNENSHNDYVDNCLLFSVQRNCVDYFITNDKGIIKKSVKLALRKRVLTIGEGIQLLNRSDCTLPVDPPAYIDDVYLYNINIEDPFFNTLKEDYDGFENWFAKRSKEHAKANITYLDEGKKEIGSFLLLKVEDERESYTSFEHPFPPGRRVKVSTLKVFDNGKSIGETYIKLMVEYALKNNVNEIYVTVFPKQVQLITLLQDYDFVHYTMKNTKKADGTIEKECVLLKRLDIDYTAYPIINMVDQRVYVVPIQNEFFKMLFPESNQQLQLSIKYLIGTATYSNTIKKVYMTKSKITRLAVGDILLFYASKVKKELSCIGVIDEVFRAQDLKTFEEFQKIVQRRTVFEKTYLEKSYQENDLIILFKYYLDLHQHISLSRAKKEVILKGPPQTIQNMDSSDFEKLVDISESTKQVRFLKTK